MSFNFNPMTEEQIDDSNSVELIEEGIYTFEVLKSTKKISKSFNQMAEIKINIWDKEGKIHVIFDYLVFSKVPLNIRKIKHFCDATGLQEEYKKGEIPEDLSHLSGKVYIGIREEQPKESGGFYPKKNIVLDYIVNSKSSNEIIPQEKFKEDLEIPF